MSMDDEDEFRLRGMKGIHSDWRAATRAARCVPSLGFAFFLRSEALLQRVEFGTVWSSCCPRCDGGSVCVGREGGWGWEVSGGEGVVVLALGASTRRGVQVPRLEA